MAFYQKRSIVEMDADRNIPVDWDYNDPYEIVSRMVNGGSRLIRRFVAKLVIEEHRTLQQKFMREVVIPFIYAQAEQRENGYYDLRNDGTTELCRYLVLTMEDAKVPLPSI
jgi:hypothetical protein